jgi:para-nitrobenzyl esterase
MTGKWLYVIALLTILGGAPAPYLNAQQTWTSPEEFRTEYLKSIDALSARIPASDESSWAVEMRQEISDLRQQVEGLYGAMSAVAVALSPSSAAAAPACVDGTTVQTSTGPVCGIVVKGVNEWLGIPYAAPPVGNLRWASPQLHAAWTTTLAATDFGSICTHPAAGKSGPNAGSEDCLFINVWAPPGAHGLPVMAHIHGGGFFNGSGAGDNTLLVNTGNVVVVAMNYRLNIFGFLANRALGPNSGDYGLQDQQAALRWVQQNISAFGGDPHSVTIFGESAGGSSVCHQIASPTAAGLFHKAISTSGEYNTLFGGPEDPRPGGSEDLELQDCKSKLPTLALAEAIGDDFAAAVGCGSALDVAACLRAVPAQTVSNAASIPGSGYQYGGHGTVAPTLNGTTLPMTLRQALKTGRVNRVPVIAGVDRDENLIGFPVTPADYTALVQRQFESIAPQVLALYPLNRFNSPFVAWRTVAADSGTVCSALRTAGDLAQWMPVFAYEIDYGDPWPQRFTGESMGAGHVNAWVLTPVTNATLDVNQQVLQNQELAFVTTLARTGNPTADGTPVWPEFKFNMGSREGNSGGLVMSLNAGADSQKTLVSQISLAHNCAFWHSVTPGRNGD